MSETTAVDSENAVVSRTFPAPPLHVWEVLIGSTGAEALLGPGASLGRKGESWHSDDGAVGVVRSVHPMEQLRVSWRENPDAPATLVEIDLSAEGDGARVDLLHSGFKGDLEADRQRWTAALERIGSLL